MTRDRSQDEFAQIDSVASETDDDPAENAGESVEPDVNSDSHSKPDNGVKSDSETSQPATAEQDDAIDAETTTTSAVTPAVSTSVWSTDGDPCDRCGSVVQRQWCLADERCCTDCMEW